MVNAGRKMMSAGRYNSGIEETAELAKSFTAYAGRYSLEADTIIHHLDICSYESNHGPIMCVSRCCAEIV